MNQIKCLINCLTKIYLSFPSQSQSIADYFNCAPSPDVKSIREFYENSDITVLAAIVNEQAIQFQHKIPQTEERCLLFYKIPKLGLSNVNNNGNTARGQSGNNNFREDDDDADERLQRESIGFLTLEGGIIKSIYNSVSRIFAPNVLKVIIFYILFFLVMKIMFPHKSNSS